MNRIPLKDVAEAGTATPNARTNRSAALRSVAHAMPKDLHAVPTQHISGVRAALPRPHIGHDVGKSRWTASHSEPRYCHCSKRLPPKNEAETHERTDLSCVGKTLNLHHQKQKSNDQRATCREILEVAEPWSSHARNDCPSRTDQCHGRLLGDAVGLFTTQVIAGC